MRYENLAGPKWTEIGDWPNISIKTSCVNWIIERAGEPVASGGESDHNTHQNCPYDPGTFATKIRKGWLKHIETQESWDDMGRFYQKMGC